MRETLLAKMAYVQKPALAAPTDRGPVAGQGIVTEHETSGTTSDLGSLWSSLRVMYFVPGLLLEEEPKNH